VLLVDDTQTTLDVMRDLLGEEGYHVSVSPEPLDATRVKALAPDVIVQDLLFGDRQETGWHFLTMSQLDPDLARIPLILCTAATEMVTNPAMAESLDRLGVRVLINPFDREELLTTIAEVLSAHELVDQAISGQDSSSTTTPIGERS
jgi:CheY-like chemotaxis protein